MFFCLFSNLNCKIKSPPSPPPSRKVREKQKESTRERERERERGPAWRRGGGRKKGQKVSRKKKKSVFASQLFSLSFDLKQTPPPPPAQLPSATFARSPTMASTSIFSCGSFSLVVELRKVSGQDARRFALMRVFASLPCFFHGGTCVAIKSLIFPPSRTRKSL